MLYIVLKYTQLATGSILIPVASFVSYKIYKGSKSIFAYVLMFFTFLDGAQFLLIFFFETKLRHPIKVGNKISLHVN